MRRLIGNMGCLSEPACARSRRPLLSTNVGGDDHDSDGGNGHGGVVGDHDDGDIDDDGDVSDGDSASADDGNHVYTRSFVSNAH